MKVGSGAGVVPGGDCGEALWEQVHADMRARILSGELTGRLESQDRLRLYYAPITGGVPVSRDTIRSALLMLEAEGLIRQGLRGREVVPPDERPEPQ